ncbi:MAG TPA: hypothetical protein VFP89_11025 [Propionibacteriaceae bacterium]|nr:hypothetical protein [Propionibacteriaceae bacterium]
MGIYARQPWGLLRQVTADVFVVVWAVAWWLVGSFVHASILGLAGPARKAASGSDRIAEEFRDAGSQVSRLPGIGDELSGPFTSAAESMSALRESAEQQVATIQHLATVGQWLAFLIPVSVVVAFWLPRRIQFLLRARAAQRLIDSGADLDLFALRAMVTQPMHVLARISDDPVTAWRSGDRAVIHRLAEIELRRSGLRLPAGLASAGDARQGLRAADGWQKMRS